MAEPWVDDGASCPAAAHQSGHCTESSRDCSCGKSHSKQFMIKSKSINSEKLQAALAELEAERQRRVQAGMWGRATAPNSAA